jgi:hypothetical protein
MKGPARANTLNHLSGPFFALVHRCLVEITFVRISKLTDPRTSGKNQTPNLTLEALMYENKRIVGIEEKYKVIVESVKKIRRYRNKIIAHTDLAMVQAPDPSTELGEVIHNNVSMALGYIRAFLYEYCKEVGQSIPQSRPVPNIPEWTHGESAGFSELARHDILNYYPFIRRDGAPFRFQLELL